MTLAEETLINWKAVLRSFSLTWICPLLLGLTLWYPQVSSLCASVSSQHFVFRPWAHSRSVCDRVSGLTPPFEFWAAEFIFRIAQRFLSRHQRHPFDLVRTLITLVYFTQYLRLRTNSLFSVNHFDFFSIIFRLTKPSFVLPLKVLCFLQEVSRGRFQIGR